MTDKMVKIELTLEEARRLGDRLHGIDLKIERRSGELAGQGYAYILLATVQLGALWRAEMIPWWGSAAFLACGVASVLLGPWLARRSRR